MIYLDSAATTHVHPEVLEAMMPYLTNMYGNAGALYGLGRQAADAIALARDQVANLVGAMPNQIVFTSGGSEANSLVFSGTKKYLQDNHKTHILTSATEHHSVIRSVESLQEDGFKTTFLQPHAKGAISYNVLKHKANEFTGIISAMYVNNETGAINPVHEIGAFCKKKNILFHTDCVQAAGIKELRVDHIGCDFMSLSAHKINAPKGVGALYVRDKEFLTPVIYGGKDQEFGLRGGTENVAHIVGYGKACEILTRDFQQNLERVLFLKNLFLKSLIEAMKRNETLQCLHNNSHFTDSKILSLTFDGVDGQTLLLALDALEIYVSVGSACRSHETHPSHVLLAMGINEERARESIRVSFSHTLSQEDVIYAAYQIADMVYTLKYGMV
jgi:cysteine desulfurase